jgi:hypothetical protein
VASSESSIDELYRSPLAGFVAARNALAKTLTGDDARRVKALVKPAAPAWAVNQVYWHARPVYDRLMKSGQGLRAAQIAALGGKNADVRGAGDAHRQAIAAAVKEALRLASAAGVNPGQDPLTQTFEALSLATKHEESPGRLTKGLQPAGFEALAGVTVKAPVRPHAVPPPPSASKDGETHTRTSHAKERDAKAAREKAEREEAEARRHAAELKTAQEAVAQAQAAEAGARAEWQRRKRELEAAEQALARVAKP